MKELMDILAILRQHRGRDNAITAPALALRVGIPERTVRGLIEDAINDGTLEELEMPVVAIPGTGFYIATDVEDFQSAYDTTRRTYDAIGRRLKSFLKLANRFGIRINTRP